MDCLQREREFTCTGGKPVEPATIANLRVGRELVSAPDNQRNSVIRSLADSRRVLGRPARG